MLGWNANRIAGANILKHMQKWVESRNQLQAWLTAFYAVYRSHSTPKEWNMILLLYGKVLQEVRIPLSMLAGLYTAFSTKWHSVPGMMSFNLSDVRLGWSNISFSTNKVVLIMCLQLSFNAIHFGGMASLRHVTSMDVCERWNSSNWVIREVATVTKVLCLTSKVWLVCNFIVHQNLGKFVGDFYTFGMFYYNKPSSFTENYIYTMQ